MKRWICLIILACVGVARGAESDDETRARKAALDLAGAFANEGFKVRDGHWSGATKPNDRTVLVVNLYAGNQYWFSAAAAEETRKVAVELFDETGKQLPTETFNDSGKAAAGFSPTTSGQYFVAVRAEGQPTTCCLLYSYK